MALVAEEGEQVTVGTTQVLIDLLERERLAAIRREDELKEHNKTLLNLLADMFELVEQTRVLKSRFGENTQEIGTDLCLQIEGSIITYFSKHGLDLHDFGKRTSMREETRRKQERIAELRAEADRLEKS